jgi:Leucine-rich repeat (LRR) protein
MKHADLRHVCEMNGINEDAFVRRAETVDTLEIFMTNPVELTLLRHFSGLVCLKIMKQPDISIISGLDDARSLKALWICECNLASTLGLERCTRLDKLVLTSNKLPRIDGLSTLTNLTSLWLNDNKLTCLTGLECLENLKQVWACRNRIQHIGSALSRNVNLTELNLADNLIGCFKEILNLCHLKSLESLSLADPHFGSNPVCNLCNYQTLVIFHLTQLTRLDMRLVNEKSKHMAQSIFLKKRMYYNMRIRTLKRNAGTLVELAEAYVSKKTQFLLDSSREVMKQVKDCEYELEELMNGQVPPLDHTGTFSYPIAAVEESPLLSSSRPAGEYNRSEGFIYHLGDCAEGSANNSYCKYVEDRKRLLLKIESIIENRLATMDMSLETAREAVHHTAGKMIENLMLEFNTGGNIRLEEGSEKDSWFNNFRQFVQSSFHAKDFESYGISGLDVNRIIRIHNRLLRQRFDARTKEVLNSLGSEPPGGEGAGQGSAAPNPNPPRRAARPPSVEYLFLRVTETMADDLEDWIFRIAEDGVQMQQAHGAAIRLSTAVWDADVERLRKQSREIRNGVKDLLDCSLVGRLLVVKIYRGRCYELEMKEEDFQRTYGAGLLASQFPGYQSLSVKLTDRSAPRRWHMLDPVLVVPEFIVEYDYIRRNDSVPPDTSSIEERLQVLWRALGSDVSNTLRVTSEEQTTDMRPFSLPVLRFARKVEFLVQSYTRLHLSEQQLALRNELGSWSSRKGFGEITECNLFQLTRANNLSALTYLNLHGQGIKQIENLSGCKKLKTLVLSFNDITRVEGLQDLQTLLELDLSFNIIRKIEGVSGLYNLKHLNLQTNLIEKIEDPEFLNKCLPQLEVFNIRQNPISRSKTCRWLLLRSFMGLQSLNGTPVTEAERSDVSLHSRCLTLEQIRKHALRSSKRVSSLSHSLECSYPASPDPASLGSSPPASHLMAVTNNARPDSRPSTGYRWTDMVEELFLDNQGIQQLQHLEHLKNLRRASFAHNELTSMSGLESCTVLEELSLENNAITAVDFLQGCKRLKRLDLGGNALTAVGKVEGLVSLTQLSIENNQIPSFSGIESLSSLMELYAANNLVAHTVELDHLRNLSKLIILDLLGNPICQGTHYRTYTIFR